MEGSQYLRVKLGNASENGRRDSRDEGCPSLDVQSESFQCSVKISDEFLYGKDNTVLRFQCSMRGNERGNTRLKPGRRGRGDRHVMKRPSGKQSVESVGKGSVDLLGLPEQIGHLETRATLNKGPILSCLDGPLDLLVDSPFDETFYGNLRVVG